MIRDDSNPDALRPWQIAFDGEQARQIKGVLSQLGPARKIAFIASSAERLQSLYREFCALNGSGEYQAVRDALDEIWKGIVNWPTNRPTEARLAELTEIVAATIPESSLAPINVLFLFGFEPPQPVLHAIRCLQEKEHITDDAGKAIYDCLHKFIRVRDFTTEDRFNTVTLEVKERQGFDPLTQFERARRLRAAQEFASLSERMGEEVVAGLKRRSVDDAINLNDLLNSEPGPPFESVRFDLDPFNHCLVGPRLQRATPKQRAVFAAGCCQRLVAIYRTCCETTGGNPRAFDSALDKIWNSLLGGHVDLGAVKRDIEAIQASTSISETGASLNSSNAVDVIRALGFTFDVLTTGFKALDVSRITFEIVQRMISDRYAIIPEAPGAWKQLLRNPLYVTEKFRQWSDLNFICLGNGFIKIHSVEAVREKAKREQVL